MLLVKKCEFDIDTNTVDIIADDGTKIFIDCDVVEDEFGLTVRHRANLDYLLYNYPVDYVNLLLSGQMKDYLDKATSFTLG